jgi:putative membrane protein
MQPAAGVVLPVDRDRPGQHGEPVEQLDDTRVLGLAHAINTLEIEQGKLAIGRARDKRVKELASQLISDHGRAEKELAEFEQKVGLKPADSAAATQLRVEATSVQNELADASGRPFDKLFTKRQVDAHERLIEALDHAIANTSHPDLKVLLQSFRPRVEAHGDKAKTLLDAMK